jgi:PAS domain S-box-containing protein
MQQIDLAQEQDFVVSFSLQRQRLLHRVSGLLDQERLPESAAVTQLSQTLMTSLELLKVAEEEVRNERRTNATVQAAQERRLSHLQALFEFAPIALVLTTADTTIREANQAAARFFGQDAHQLTGAQLSHMVPRAQQTGFREQLAHVIEAGEAAVWRFTVELPRSAPAIVSCAVNLITDASVGTRALYWSIQPVPGAV